jgi:hypothetical protein
MAHVTVMNPPPADPSVRPAFIGRYLLGVAFLAYLGSTVLVYFWGPWRYPMIHGSRDLIVFLLAVHAAFAAGYVIAARAQPAASRVSSTPERIVLIAAIVDLAMLFPTSAYATGHWLPIPWAAARDLADAYTSSLQRRDAGTPYVFYVRMVLAPLSASLLPLAVFYWRRLSPTTRSLAVASTAGTIALFVAMGANAGLAHFVAIFPWFVVAAHIAGVQRLGSKQWLLAAGVSAVAAVAFAAMFTATMVVREGSFARDGYIPGIGARTARGAIPSADVQPGDRMSLASKVRVGFDGLTAYLTHGYFAVYLSLREPFMPCYGVGNSVFLQRQVSRVAGDAYFIKCPYPARIETAGWLSGTYWSTIYPWIASDVGFPGTVVVMLALGWLCGRVWLDAIGGRNLCAVVFLGQLLMVLYYVPAHNKVMHSGEGVFACSFWLLAWSTTRASAESR